MELYQAILLGLVQGFTEVLPISSSGHLVLFPWFLDFPDPGLSFSVALHMGTLTAIITYFWGDVVSILKGLMRAARKHEKKELDERLPFYLMLATLPGIVLGIALASLAEDVFRAPLLVAANTFIFGVVLLAAERKVGKKELKDYTPKSSFITGLYQAIAIIPGVSRSGITISGSMFQGFTRETAARFSFLISIPIIAGAGLIELRKIPPADFSTMFFWAGFFSAVIASFISVKFLMGFVKNHKLNIFAYYRFALAIFIVILYFLRN